MASRQRQVIDVGSLVGITLAAVKHRTRRSPDEDDEGWQEGRKSEQFGRAIAGLGAIAGGYVKGDMMLKDDAQKEEDRAMRRADADCSSGNAQMRTLLTSAWPMPARHHHP